MLLRRDQRAWHRKGPFVPTGPDDVRVVTIPSFNVNQVPQPNPSPGLVCILSFVSFVSCRCPQAFFAPAGETLNGPNFVSTGLKSMPKAMVRAWLDAARETDAVEGVNEEVREPERLCLPSNLRAKLCCCRPVAQSVLLGLVQLVQQL